MGTALWRIDDTHQRILSTVPGFEEHWDTVSDAAEKVIRAIDTQHSEPFFDRARDFKSHTDVYPLYACASALLLVHLLSEDSEWKQNISKELLLTLSDSLRVLRIPEKGVALDRLVFVIRAENALLNASRGGSATANTAIDTNALHETSSFPETSHEENASYEGAPSLANHSTGNEAPLKENGSVHKGENSHDHVSPYEREKIHETWLETGVSRMPDLEIKRIAQGILRSLMQREVTPITLLFTQSPYYAKESDPDLRWAFLYLLASCALLANEKDLHSDRLMLHVALHCWRDQWPESAQVSAIDRLGLISAVAELTRDGRDILSIADISFLADALNAFPPTDLDGESSKLETFPVGPLYDDSLQKQLYASGPQESDILGQGTLLGIRIITNIHKFCAPLIPTEVTVISMRAVLAVAKRTRSEQILGGSGPSVIKYLQTLIRFTDMGTPAIENQRAHPSSENRRGRSRRKLEREVAAAVASVTAVEAKAETELSLAANEAARAREDSNEPVSSALSPSKHLRSSSRHDSRSRSRRSKSASGSRRARSSSSRPRHRGPKSSSRSSHRHSSRSSSRSHSRSTRSPEKPPSFSESHAFTSLQHGPLSQALQEAHLSEREDLARFHTSQNSDEILREIVTLVVRMIGSSGLLHIVNADDRTSSLVNDSDDSLPAQALNLTRDLLKSPMNEAFKSLKALMVGPKKDHTATEQSNVGMSTTDGDMSSNTEEQYSKLVAGSKPNDIPPTLLLVGIIRALRHAFAEQAADSIDTSADLAPSSSEQSRWPSILSLGLVYVWPGIKRLIRWHDARIDAEVFKLVTERLLGTHTVVIKTSIGATLRGLATSDSGTSSSSESEPDSSVLASLTTASSDVNFGEWDMGITLLTHFSSCIESWQSSSQQPIRFTLNAQGLLSRDIRKRSGASAEVIQLYSLLFYIVVQAWRKPNFTGPGIRIVSLILRLAPYLPDAESSFVIERIEKDLLCVPSNPLWIPMLKEVIDAFLVSSAVHSCRRRVADLLYTVFSDVRSFDRNRTIFTREIILPWVDKVIEEHFCDDVVSEKLFLLIAEIMKDHVVTLEDTKPSSDFLISDLQCRLVKIISLQADFSESETIGLGDASFQAASSLVSLFLWCLGRSSKESSKVGLSLFSSLVYIVGLSTTTPASSARIPLDRARIITLMCLLQLRASSRGHIYYEAPSSSIVDAQRIHRDASATHVACASSSVQARVGGDDIIANVGSASRETSPSREAHSQAAAANESPRGRNRERDRLPSELRSVSRSRSRAPRSFNLIPSASNASSDKSRTSLNASGWLLLPLWMHDSSPDLAFKSWLPSFMLANHSSSGRFGIRAPYDNCIIGAHSDEALISNPVGVERPSDSEWALRLSDYYEALGNVILHDSSWEVVSLCLVYLPAQLQNIHLTQDVKSSAAISHLALSLAETIRIDSGRGPTTQVPGLLDSADKRAPEISLTILSESLLMQSPRILGAPLKKGQVMAMCISIIGTHFSLIGAAASRFEQEILLDSLMIGLENPRETAGISLGFLSVLVSDAAAPTMKAFTQILRILQRIISSQSVSSHILQFLVNVGLQPSSILANLTSDDFKTVFGIAFKYIDNHNEQQLDDPDFARLRPDLTNSLSVAFHLYLYELALNVVCLWFLGLKLVDRPKHIPFILKQFYYSMRHLQELPSDYYVIYDMLTRYSYSDADPRPRKSSFTSHLEQQENATDSRTWIYGFSVITITPMKSPGWYQIVSRQPTGSSRFLVDTENVSAFTKGAGADRDLADWLLTQTRTREQKRSLPKRRYSTGTSPSKDSSGALVTDPAFMQSALDALDSNAESDKTVRHETPEFMMLFGNPGLGVNMNTHVHQPTRVPNEPQYIRSLGMLDRTPIVDLYRIAILYVGPGQTSETQILSNQYGNPTYTRMITSIGDLVPLKGARDRDIYTAGLDTSEDLDGRWTCVWDDEVSQIVFHIPTLMPNSPDDPACVRKKAHVGNDYVKIVYNNSNLPYAFDTIKSDFNFVNIVIEPIAFTPYSRVILQQRPGMISLWVSPAPKIVHSRNVPTYVRQLAIQAHMYSELHLSSVGFESTRSGIHHIDHAPSWCKRFELIDQLRRRLGIPPPPRHKNINAEISEHDFTAYL